MANKDEVVRRLCSVVSRIGTEIYKSNLSHDCFCADSHVHDPRVDVAVLNWIDLWLDAVIAARQCPGAPPALTDAEREMVTASPSMGFWMTNPEVFQKMVARCAWLEQDRILMAEEIQHWRGMFEAEVEAKL